MPSVCSGSWFAVPKPDQHTIDDYNNVDSRLQRSIRDFATLQVYQFAKP